MPRQLTPTELKTRRVALGLSQSDLAEYLGVKQNTLSQWENGMRGIPAGISAELETVENMVDDLMHDLIEMAEAAAEDGIHIALITHTEPESLRTAHPEMDGYPVGLHQVAVARARAFIVRAFGDVPIYSSQEVGRN